VSNTQYVVPTVSMTMPTPPPNISLAFRDREE
jgi:hypothetical protein